MDRLRTFQELQQQAHVLEETERRQLLELEGTRESMRRVDAKIRQLTNQVAPISTLPTEILGTILGINNSQHSRESSRFDELPPIVVASHINRRFREVSVGTPALWTDIIFSFCKPLACLDAWLERSGTCLIDIQLQGSQQLVVDDVLARIIPHVSRWRTFDANQVGSLCMSTIVSSFRPLFAPHLQALELNQMYESAAHGQINPSRGTIFANGAPFLASLDMTDVCLLSCMPPMSALTRLELQTLDERIPPLSHEEFRRALAASPLLTHLVLYIEVIASQTNARIVLPSLCSMELSLSQYYDDDYIFVNYLIAPKLEELGMSYMSAPQCAIFRTFVCADIQSACPALRSLSLCESDECADHIDVDFFRALPTITELCVLRCGENSILNRLIPPGDADMVLLPRLIVLEVAEFNLDLLCDTVSSRMAAGCPLRTVVLLCNATQIPAGRLCWLRERAELRF